MQKSTKAKVCSAGLGTLPSAQRRKESRGKRLSPAGQRPGGSVVEAEAPYMPGAEFFVDVRGHWAAGGLVEIRIANKVVKTFEFAAAPWAVFANLVLAAIRAKEDHYFHSYVLTKALANVVGRLEVLQVATPEKIHREINRIRAKIAESDVADLTGSPELAGKDWAEAFVRSHPNYGYRVAVPRKNLRLFIGDDEFQVAGTEDQGRDREGE